MKRQIDPNLNGFGGDDFLSPPKNEDVSGFRISGETETSRENRQSPDFTVTEKEEDTHARDYHASESHRAKAEMGTLNHEYAAMRTKNGSSGSHSHSHSHSGSHHHSSHHSSSSKKKKKKLPLPLRIAIVILVILLIFVFTAGGVILYLRQTGKNDLIIEKPETPYEETIEYNGSTYVYDKNKIAFAFIGVDKQEIGEGTSDAYGNSGQADTDMVAVVDTSTGNVSIITIPRDTMVDIDLYSASGIFLRTEPRQLCLAYAYGDGGTKSCTNVTSALSRILKNVPIEKYFALDLEGIAPLNDAVGGVTVQALHDFPEKNIKKGETITIRGDFAETYVRSRDMDYIEASLNRTQRQNQYVKAYTGQLRKAVTNDFSVVTSLYNTATDYSQTNITLNDVTYLASLILSKGVGDFTHYSIDGEMKASKEVVREDGVYAEFYADENSVLDAVVNCFYTKVS